MVSEKKRLKNIQQKERKQQIERQASLSRFPWRWFSLLSPTGKFCAWVVLILGCVGAYYNFSPKLSILPSEAILDTSNPFSKPFTLKNDSLYRIYNVKPYRTIIHNVNNRSCKININLVEPPIPQIESGETTTFKLPVNKFDYADAPINYLNIEIVVFYCPPIFTFLQLEKHVRFVTLQSKDGKLNWNPKAMSE